MGGLPIRECAIEYKIDTPFGDGGLHYPGERVSIVGEHNRALSWDFSEHVTDVIFEAYEKATERVEVAIVIVDNNDQETHVSFHMDNDSAVSYSKYFANFPNVYTHILDPKETFTSEPSR